MPPWAGPAVALLILGAAGCTGRSIRPTDADPPLRRVTARVVRPAPVDLYDRRLETVAVVAFEGPGGRDLARDLARRLARTGAFQVVVPDDMEERLMRAGLTVRWDESPSALRWVHERTGVDAVVGGRVVEFRVEGFEQEKQTLAPEPTGEFVFVRTEEGKLAYREKLAYRPVPLFCRTDTGTVGARYRVWDLRRGEVVATLPRKLTTQVPSFCYRGDVSADLIREAQGRLLKRLFGQLNRQVLESLVPEHERRDLFFEVVGPGVKTSLVHANELGILHASQGRWRQAIETWEECVRLAPDAAWARYNLGVALAAVGRRTEARKQFQEAWIRKRRPVYRRTARELGRGSLETSNPATN
ncbi:tetratricopeptide repeat protein [Deferrisoma camini]|uniref:tetratricopeptide repeat protein n=1 Tax=Deferrisoma camini TaxID=1035120 RepID=UPI00046D8DD6|nr:tetratricopeptide repeat protein [Deferrisoma camini]